MKRLINQFIEQHNLCTKLDSMLIAVSGGVDSIVLAQAMVELGYSVSLAHCNFGLRGEESDLDAQLVQRLASKLDVEIHLKSFDTEQYSEKEHVSIQMAARSLRYEWFTELCKVHGYTKLATAHHRDDQIETVLLNLTRGTGIKGLEGMQPIRPMKKDVAGPMLIRPLLEMSKDLIRSYAVEHKLEWREDASNASNKYKRNSMRNEVIPLLQKQNINFESRFVESVSKFSEAGKIYAAYVENSIAKIKISETEIDIEQLLKSVSPVSILWELLKPMDFHYSTVQDLLACLQNDGETGKTFYSINKMYGVFINRGRLEFGKMDPLDEDSSWDLNLEGDRGSIATAFGLFDYSTLKRGEVEKKELIDPDFAFLDLRNLQFPLKIRKWKAGDRFRPFGMSNYQKVSDFLVNNKVSRFEKEKVCVLLSEEKIVWVAGHRIDNFHGMGEDSTLLLKIRLQKST